MNASEEFICPSPPHAENCATEGNGFCDPEPEVAKEASPETGEVEETMEITSTEGAIKREDDPGSQNFGERDEALTRGFVVLRYVKMIQPHEVPFLSWE